MLPRETTVRQLKKLRAETKGTDIGDLTSGDRLNHNVPNLQYIGNPVDNKIESWEDFSKHDSQLQTIAFKSKLVNKPLVKENKTKIMKEKINNVLAFNDFEKNWKAEEAKKTKRTEVAKDIVKEDIDIDDVTTDVADDGKIIKYNEPEWEERDIEPSYFEEYPEEDDELNRDDLIDLIYNNSEIEIEELEEMSDEELKELYDGLELDDDDDDDDDEDDEDDDDFDKDKDELILDDDDDDDDIEESVQTYESFTLKDAPKEEKQPEYTMLGKEKEIKSNPNFGVAAVKDQENKKIAFFNSYEIDPKTPKERPILNAGQFVHTEKVRGYVNRIEGSKVFVESLDEPMKIVEISLKDAVKPPIEVKEEIKKFDEICIELNKEFLKDK